MKSVIKYMAMAFVGAVLLTACAKDNARNHDRFRIVVHGFENQGDSKVQFADNNYTRMIFQSGDKLWVNGIEFHVDYDGTAGQWVATRYGRGDNTIPASTSTYYCLYTNDNNYDGSVNYNNGTYSILASSQYGGPSTYVDQTSLIADRQVCYSGNIILAGTTTDSMIHLYPIFAVIKIDNTANKEYPARVAFPNNTIPKGNITVTPGNGSNTISYTNTLIAPWLSDEWYYDDDMEDDVHNLEGDCLSSVVTEIAAATDAKRAHHIIVPLPAQSVTTDLFVTREAAKYKYLKLQNVTLQAGCVYSLSIN